MSRPFLLEPDEQAMDYMSRIELDGERALTLPGVECPVCDDAWAISGIEYPTVDITPLKSALGKVDPWPVSIAAFCDIKAKVARIVGNDILIVPGAGFGPLVKVHMKRELLDLVWMLPWTLLLNIKALRKISDSGIHLAVRKIEPGRNGSMIEYFEVEARPTAGSKIRRTGMRCHACGREEFQKPKKIVLDRSAYDETIPVQRVREWPTKLVISGALMEVISRHSLAGAKITPLLMAT